MEKAREAFAGADQLGAVRVATVPGMLQLLEVTAPAVHDWADTHATMQAQGYWFTPYRADDVAVNVRARTLAEREVAAADRAERQAAWAVLGTQDPRLLAERVLLHAVEVICAERRTLWDPRLEEVAGIVEALRDFWSAAAPALPREVVQAATAIGPLPAAAVLPAVASADLPHRVRRLLAREVPPDAQPGFQAAAAVVGARDQHWGSAQLAWQRVGVVCREVGGHLLRSALSTRDAARAAAYRSLASRCDEVAAAVDLLLGR